MMMCGCPIGAATSPWPYTDFEVVPRRQTEFPLAFETTALAPSQFSTSQWIPGDYGVFEITVRQVSEEHGQHGRRSHERKSGSPLGQELTGTAHPFTTVSAMRVRSSGG